MFTDSHLSDKIRNSAPQHTLNVSYVTESVLEKKIIKSLGPSNMQEVEVNCSVRG
jgi:hypothetical protein